MAIELGGDIQLNQYYDPHYQYTFHYEQAYQPIMNNVESNPAEPIVFNQAQYSSTVDNHDDSHEYCQICGDTASGWHCGAITCEACKKFFLRSISANNDGRKKYQCQKNFQCIITKRSRTQCQYCRLAKCLSVGMRINEETIGNRTEDLYKKLPCLVCGASASGIHFGAVTCEACKGFFRRSIRENAPDRYQCVENNQCEINSTTKITCRACRFEKCVQVGMSIEASRIGRQSNLFKQSIRQIQNGSATMATVNDSARIATMAKRRKTKTKERKIYLSTTQIDLELHPSTKEFVDHIYNSFLKYLTNLPRCVSYETIWSTMATQMMNYAHSLLNFCQTILPNFSHMVNYELIVSSSIHSVVILSLFHENRFTSNGNYWRTDEHLTVEFARYLPQLKEIEDLFLSFEAKLKEFQLDEREISLLILMILTRTTLNLSYDETQFWTKYQFESVQTLSQYMQVRRSNQRNAVSIEFYDVAFIVSELRTLNHRFNQCLAQIPWSTLLPQLPTLFYRLFLVEC